MVSVRQLFLGILLLAFAGCTTSKWTVVDEHAVDSNEKPEIVQNSIQLVPEKKPTLESPVLRLVSYNIVQSEFAERVQLQRTVQEYKPKWGFALLTLTGAAISVIAANSDYLLPSANTSQRIALNATGAILTVLAATNLEEKGEPILTDEIRYLRQTGFDVQTDTLQIDSFNSEPASITVYNGENVLLNEQTISTESGFIEINLGALTSEISHQLDSTSNIEVRVSFNDSVNTYSFPVTDFLEPYFVIQEQIAEIRNTAVISRDNIIEEIGEGSALKLVNEVSDVWNEVRFNDLNAFIQREDGRVEWRSTAEDGPAILFEVADIPFGEIDVESSVPVLKPRNPADRAIILSGNDGNQAGSNQFSDRDEQLIMHYMMSALSMGSSQIRTLESADLLSWTEELKQCEEMNGGSFHIYLTGYARSYSSDSGSENLELFHVDESGTVDSVPLMNLFDQLAECNAEKMFVYVDLEYVEEVENGQIISFMNSNGGKQQRLANRLLRDFANAYVLFGNRIGQSSSEFSGSPEDDKRHHIFPYYWAEAIQKRKTQMSELLRHLENNVDYTSRRLHDKPQEVQGFGKLMLDIAK